MKHLIRLVFLFLFIFLAGCPGKGGNSEKGSSGESKISSVVNSLTGPQTPPPPPPPRSSCLNYDFVPVMRTFPCTDMWGSGIRCESCVEKVGHTLIASPWMTGETAAGRQEILCYREYGRTNLRKKLTRMGYCGKWHQNR